MPYKDPNSAAAKASSARKSKRWRECHPEQWKAINNRTQRHRYYKCVHGISEAEFEAQIAVQNNLCPIGNHPFGRRGKNGDSPCQDHDHESGQNRLILCRNHNVALGLFNDSIEDMQQAVSYLKSFKKETGELQCPTLQPSEGRSQELSN